MCTVTTHEHGCETMVCDLITINIRDVSWLLVKFRLFIAVRSINKPIGPIIYGGDINICVQ
jgi:hypothetical protein